MRRAYFLAATFLTASVAVASAQVSFVSPNGGGGYTIITPGGPSTFVTPNGGGGYTSITPGGPTTFISPNGMGGYTAITPGIPPVQQYNSAPYGYRRY